MWSLIHQENMFYQMCDLDYQTLCITFTEHTHAWFVFVFIFVMKVFISF